MDTVAVASATGMPVRTIRAGMWLLPVHGLLLALSTLTHQPDPETEFEALARYVTTDIFLLSHLGASILGAGLGMVGVVATLLVLVHSRAAAMALAGTALTVVANTLLIAVFAAAAFTQPAIGRAFLAGDEGMPQLHDAVYGAPLLATVGVGLLLFIAGAVAFGVAVARTSPKLRWAGYGYAGGLCVFALLGFTVPVAQPVGAAVAAVCAIVIASRLPDAALSAGGLRPEKRAVRQGWAT